MNREVSTQRDRMNCQRSNATCTSMGNSFGFYYCSAPKSDWWGPASILDVKNWDVMAREKGKEAVTRRRSPGQGEPLLPGGMERQPLRCPPSLCKPRHNSCLYHS